MKSVKESRESEETIVQRTYIVTLKEIGKALSLEGELVSIENCGANRNKVLVTREELKLEGQRG